MAIYILDVLRDITFSPMKQPRCKGAILINVLNFSIWGAFGTGCVAGASTIFSRVVIERNTLTPPIFKASMISCATFIVFAAFLIYRSVRISSIDSAEKREPVIKKFYADTVSLESRLGLTFGITSIAAMLARHILKTPPTIKTIADCSILPLLSITTTITAIVLFHDYQRKKMKQLV